MIAIYRPCGKIQDMAGNCITQIKAVGYCLPTAEKLQYELHGHWTKNPKHGVQYEVDSFEEVIVPTKEGIIAYLSSGQIRGVGLKTAERIYEAFGKDTLKVLDEEPQKLLAVHGIRNPTWPATARGMLSPSSPLTALRQTGRSNSTGNTGRRPWKSFGTIRTSCAR